MQENRTTKLSQAFPVPGFPAGNHLRPGTLISYCRKGLSVPGQFPFPGKPGNANPLFFKGAIRVPGFPPYKGGMCSPGTHTYPIAIFDQSGREAGVRNGHD